MLEFGAAATPPAADAPSRQAAFFHSRPPERGIDPLHDVQASYDTVVEEYVRRISRELEAKPFDCAPLDRFAARLAGQGPVWDLLPRQEVTPTLVEWRRVTKPGGLLLLAVHLGENALHLDEWWGQRVSVDFAFFRTQELVGYLEAAGWHTEETIERDPYPGVETQTRRVYILANASPTLLEPDG